jgi:putative flippase GtrA
MDSQDTSVASVTFSKKIENVLTQRPVILQLCRFVAIGLLNTGLDFIILNFFSKLLGIDHGVRLGYVNVIGFSLATIQSYIWNRYWAFDTSNQVGVLKNFVRLILVGGLGVAAFALVFFGVATKAVPGFYLISFVLMIIGQVALWFNFKLNSGSDKSSHSTQFIAFLIVSIVGLLINSGLITLVSSHLPESVSAELVKNIAKVVATAVSLIWNFIGYKLIVFKK